MATNSVLQALMSGREEGRRKRAFEVDQQRVLAELKELERSSKAAAEAEKRAIDLENFTIMQALREQLVTGQKHLEGSTGEMTQPGIPGTQEVSIPSPTQTLQGPFGEEQFDTQSIIRDITSRRGEEERKLGLALQEALIKEIPKRETEGFKAQAKLEETREIIEGRENVANIQSKTRETPAERLERGEALERLKSKFRKEEIRLKAQLGEGEKNEELLDAVDSVTMLRRDLNDFPSRNRSAIITAAKRAGLAVPNKKAVIAIEGMAGLFSFQDEMKDFTDLLQQRNIGSGTLERLSAAITGTGELAIGISEIARRREELIAKAALIAKRARGEAGNPSNRDIERQENSFPSPKLPTEDNLRRLQNFNNEIEEALNTSMSSIPVPQRQKIFDDRGLPFRAKNVEVKKVESDEGVKVTEAEINRVVSATGVSREEAIAEIRKFK